MPLYTFAQEDFDTDLFLEFVNRNGLSTAVKTQISLISTIHNELFKFVPEPIKYLQNKLGTNKKEIQRFIHQGNKTPYLFSGSVFWQSFLNKSLDWYSFKSLLWQDIKMLNPKFFLDVVRSIKNRLSEKVTYHLE